MESDRWHRVERLYHSALNLSGDQRALFLKVECQDDEDLRKEVESLLSYENFAAEFIELPAFSVAAKLMAEDKVKEQITDAAATLTVSSRLRILEKLGSGGMGIVYKAEDAKLRRLVALKFLHPEFSHDPQALERFQREAYAASALNHPNICTVYDVDEYQGQPFISIELLQGQTLEQHIGARPLPTSELLALAIQIAGALEAAHAKGILHRDIKPSNIFVTDHGTPKILDFGIAKLQECEATGSEKTALLSEPNHEWNLKPTLTRPSMAIGTAGYMSPEQTRGEKLDVRTDLFSFGLVLYEMATGERAFRGATGPELLKAIVEQAPVTAGRLNPELPVKLESIISKAIQKERSARYQSAKELREELETLKREVEEQSPLHRWLFATLLPVVLLVAGTGLWFVTQRPSQTLPDLKLRQLTDNSSENAVLAGSLSPDGKKLAYSDTTGIKIKSVESGEIHSVQQPAVFQDRPVEWRVRSWFPDGRRFLANAIRRGLQPWEVGSQGTSVWIFSIGGAEPHKIRDDAIAYSASPDGSLICFGANWRGDGDREIWVMDSSGGAAHKIYGTDQNGSIRDAVWSPNGRLTAFDRADQTGSSVVIVDIKDGATTTLFSSDTAVVDYLWLRDGRLLYALYEPEVSAVTCNLWQIRLSTNTGKPKEKPRKLTSWSDFCMSFAGATADSRQLAFLKTKPHITTFVADLDATGAYLSNPRHLSSDSLGAVGDWTVDSNSLLFSDGQIVRQSLNGDVFEPLAAAPKEGVRDLRVSPDGKWILYFPQETTRPEPDHDSSLVTLMRMPAIGGRAQPLLKVRHGSSLRCARRPYNLCAIAEPSGEQMIITAFDPLKGRGSELARFAFDSNSEDWQWDLSPDGSRIAALSNPAGAILLFPLRGHPAQFVRVKGWSNLRSVSWSANGKGLFVASDSGRPAGAALLHVDLRGNTSVIWKQLTAFSVTLSPDGRHIAFSGNTEDDNLWMMENF